MSLPRWWQLATAFELRRATCGRASLRRARPCTRRRRLWRTWAAARWRCLSRCPFRAAPSTRRRRRPRSTAAGRSPSCRRPRRSMASHPRPPAAAAEPAHWPACRRGRAGGMRRRRRRRRRVVCAFVPRDNHCRTAVPREFRRRSVEAYTSRHTCVRAYAYTRARHDCIARRLQPSWQMKTCERLTVCLSLLNSIEAHWHLV